MHGHGRSAQIDAGGRGEASLQAVLVGAVHEAGSGDDGALERLGVGSAVRDLLVEHDGAAPESFGGVLANLEVVGAGGRPPVDRARFIAGDILAEAVELAGAEAYRLDEKMAPEDAVTELGHRQLERPRRDEDLVDAGDDVERAGKAEEVGAQGDERTDRQDAAAFGRHPVTGAALASGAHR